MLGVPLEQVAVHLAIPVSRFLRGLVDNGARIPPLRRLRRLCEASRNDCLGSRVDPEQSQFADGKITNGTRSACYMRPPQAAD